jgi:Flp pilus assembly protein TadD/transglutaminase-like putative cysteine protease
MTLFLAAVCVLGSAAPWEAEAFTADPAAILAALKEQAPPPDADHEVLLEETTLRVDAQRRVQRESRLVVRVLQRDAVENWADLQAVWAAWYQQRPEFEARVIASDGKEFRLDPKTIVEGAVRDENRALFSDSKMLRAPLPAVAPGAVIERRVRLGQHRPFFPAGTLSGAALGSSPHTRKIRLVVEAPPEVPLRYEVRGAQVQPQKTTAASVVRWTLEMDKPPAGDDFEPLMPAERPRLRRFLFTTGTTWAEIAAEYARVAERQLNLDDVRPLVGGFAGLSREQAALRCLRELQTNVRYTGLRFGDSSIVPRPARETWAARYGDCKDQALLLAGMLRACGHPAHLALLRTGEIEDLVPALPALNAFNHAIVYVPGEPPLWIDPTVPFARPGQLPWEDQGRWTLVAGEQTKDLVRTPRSNSRASDLVDVRELFLAEDGRGRVKIVIEARGTEEAPRRAGYAAQPRDETRKSWEKYLAEAYPGAAMKSLDSGDPKDFDTPFRVGLQAEGGGIAAFTDDAAQLVVPLAERLSYLPESLLPETQKATDAPRKLPLHLPAPSGREVRYRVVAPDGFTVGKLPQNVDRTWGPCTLRLEFSSPQPREVQMRFRFDLGDGQFAAADVDAFRRGIRECNRTGLWQPVLQFERTTARLFREQKFREGLAEHRRLLRQNPDSAPLHMRYGKALLTLGFGEAAREAYRKAVALAPQSATVHAELGYCLVHDLFGRDTQPGMDLVGAMAAKAKAVELAPDDDSLRFQYAILLEFDRDGFRYGRRSRLNDAIAQHQKTLVNLPDNEAVVSSLGVDLLHARRFEEVRALVGQHQLSVDRLALRLAATAALEGVPAAFAAHADVDDNVRQQALLKACDLLSNLRMYAEAADLVDLLAPKAAAADRLRGLADTWRAQRRVETVLAPPDDPRRVVQELYVAVLLGGSYEEQVARLFVSRNVRRASVEELQLSLQPLRRSALANGQPPERRADALSAMKLTVDGDERVGKRVQVDMPGIAAPGAWYVVRQQDAWKLWEPGRDNEELGMMALSRLHHGDQAGATQWLRWAVDTERAVPSLFDPLNGSPFRRGWMVLDPKKPDDLQLLAALCAAGSTEDQRAQTILLARRQALDNSILRFQIDRALLQGHERQQRFADALAVLERLLESNPQRIGLRLRKARVLCALRRRDELQQTVAKLQADHPNDEFLALDLAYWLACGGEFSRAVERLQPLVDKAAADKKAKPFVEAGALNNLVWNSLFLDEVPPTIAARANRLVEVAATANELHTAAAAFAELGQIAEARRVFLRMLAVRGRDDPVDWYVVGRLAEHLDLPEVAASAYRRVEKSSQECLDTTYDLAQRRLGRLRK